MDETLDTALIINICLAVRQNKVAEAQKGWQRLLGQVQATHLLLLKSQPAEKVGAAEKTDASAEAGEQAQLDIGAAGGWLQQVCTCLLTAARAKNTQLVQAWLRETVLLDALTKQELAQQSAQLLLDLAFAVCDKRLNELQPELKQILRAWLKSGQNWQQVDKLFGELLNLAAHMARRGWTKETRMALRLVAFAALRQRETAFWQALLARFNLHFAGYAHWDGFPKACQVYKELVLLLLVLVRRAGRSSESEERRIAYLQLALRSVRAWVTNIARSTMQDDMDIFRQWYQFMWQLAGEDVLRKQRLLLLLQLCIKYWHSTLPKSSRKQLRFLQDLLEPNLVSEEYAALLRKIV